MARNPCFVIAIYEENITISRECYYHLRRMLLKFHMIRNKVDIVRIWPSLTNELQVMIVSD